VTPWWDFGIRSLGPQLRMIRWPLGGSTGPAEESRSLGDGVEDSGCAPATASDACISVYP
jgi:hypothetical protein